MPQWHSLTCTWFHDWISEKLHSLSRTPCSEASRTKGLIEKLAKKLQENCTTLYSLLRRTLTARCILHSDVYFHSTMYFTIALLQQLVASYFYSTMRFTLWRALTAQCILQSHFYSTMHLHYIECKFMWIFLLLIVYVLWQQSRICPQRSFLYIYIILLFVISVHISCSGIFYI